MDEIEIKDRRAPCYAMEKVADLDATITRMKVVQAENAEKIDTIAMKIEPLEEIADGVKGLRVIGKFFIWVGGLGAGIVVLLQVIGK